MVASRDIKAGEVILKEAPLIAGPKQRSAPVCLGCHRPVDGKYLCRYCGWALCGPSCEKSKYHKVR